MEQDKTPIRQKSYRYIVFIVDLAVGQKILLRTLDFGKLLKYLRYIYTYLMFFLIIQPLFTKVTFLHLLLKYQPYLSLCVN